VGVVVGGLAIEGLGGTTTGLGVAEGVEGVVGVVVPGCP